MIMLFAYLVYGAIGIACILGIIGLLMTTTPKELARIPVFVVIVMGVAFLGPLVFIPSVIILPLLGLYERRVQRIESEQP